MEDEYKTRTRSLIDDVVEGACFDQRTDETGLETADMNAMQDSTGQR